MAAARWTRDENMFLLRVWSEANGDGRARRDPEWTLHRAYRLFVHMLGEKSTPSESVVCEQIATLRFHFDFIQRFNKMRTPREQKSWFDMSPHKRETAFHRNAGSHYGYVAMDYHMFATLEAVEGTCTEASAGPSPPRQAHGGTNGSLPGEAWTVAEIAALVQAWREVMEDCQDKRSTRPRTVFPRIHDRFVELIGKATLRTKKAVYAKKFLLASTHAMITSIMEHKKTRNWFSFAKTRKRAIVNEQFGSTTKVNIADIDRDLYYKVGHILALEEALERRARDAYHDSDSEDEIQPGDKRDDSGWSSHRMSTRRDAKRVLDLSTEHLENGAQCHSLDQERREQLDTGTAVCVDTTIDAIEARVRRAATELQYEVASELWAITHAVEDQVERIERVLHKLSRDQSSEDGIVPDLGQHDGRRKRQGGRDADKERRSDHWPFDGDDDNNDEQQHSRKWRRY